MTARGKVYRKESVMKRHLRSAIFYVVLMAVIVGIRMNSRVVGSIEIGVSLMWAAAAVIAIGFFCLPFAFSITSKQATTDRNSFFMMDLFKNASDFHKTFSNSNIKGKQYNSRIEKIIDLALPFIIALPVAIIGIILSGGL